MCWRRIRRSDGNMDREDLGISNQSRYLQRVANAPAYEHTGNGIFFSGGRLVLPDSWKN